MEQVCEAGAPLLLVDDDPTFRNVLGKALERRGFAVRCAGNAEEALPLLEAHPPAYAVFDLKLPGASGLTLVTVLHRINPAARIVVLTGYGSIATAVDAVRLGATHFLTKPANADEVVAAFSYTPQAETGFVPPLPFSPRQEAEYLVRVLEENNYVVARTARVLGMHRRTLQRKLARLVPGKD
jgi:two-component system response regulator RegA